MIQDHSIPSDLNLINPDEHEPIHARGPEFVGVEDMGPQDPSRGPNGEGRFDMAAAVGRRGEGEMVLVSGGKSGGMHGEGGEMNEGLKGEGKKEDEEKGEMEGVEMAGVVSEDTGMEGLEREGEKDAEGEVVPAEEEEGFQEGIENKG